jgi:hypothetical protein
MANSSNAIDVWQGTGDPIARVEDVSLQPRRWDFNLFIVPTVSFRSPPNLMAGSDVTPDRRMDCPVTHRSLRLGLHTEVHPPRSGPGLISGVLALGMGNRTISQLLPLRFRQVGILTGLVGAAGGIGGFFLAKALGIAKGMTGRFGVGFLVLRCAGLSCLHWSCDGQVALAHLLGFGVGSASLEFS